MKYCEIKIRILVSVFVISHAQFPAEVVTKEPWTGPIADHQLGVHPSDTAEVIAAKTQHLKAYQDVLAVLPELPPEERYVMHGLPLPVVHALQEQAQDQLNNYVQQLQPVLQTLTPTNQQFVPHVQNLQNIVELQTTPITLFAEEVPRSSIGEVPEVHAARVAHLKTFQEAAADVQPFSCLSC